MKSFPIKRSLRLRRFYILSLAALLLLHGGMAAAQNRPAPVNRGYELLERGWVNDAIAAFQAAVRQYPQSVEAKLGLAIAYQRAGQDSNAWQAYQQVLQQDANNRAALSAIGTLGSYRPEWQAQGINALTALLSLDPNNLSARAQRALLLGYQGRFTDAIADYEVVLRSNPSAEVVLGAAQIYTYSGDYAQGVALFDRYRRSGTIPNSAIAAYALALQETGRAAEAVAALEPRLQRLSATSAEAVQLRAALAIAYQRNQQTDDALAALAPLRTNPAARLPLARSLSTIARQTGDRGQYLEAIALYRQVLADAANPTTALIIEAADVLSEVPDTHAEALELYQRVAEPSLSVSIKQLILRQTLGQLTRSALTEQLQPLLQPLPEATAERRAIAQALVRLDSPDPALLPLYQTLASEVDVPFLYFRMAQMQLAAGDFAAARQLIATYTSTPQGSTDLAPELLLAEIDRRDGNLEASAQRYAAILAQESPDAIWQNAARGLAGIRLAQSQPEAALTLYEQLLVRYPDDARAHLGRARLAYQLGQVSIEAAEAVLAQWQQAASPSPELIDLVGALPADPQRESLYQSLLAIEPDSYVLNRRWVQTLAARDPAAAAATVEAFISRNPDNLSGFWLKGELAQSMGDLERASQAYQQILDREPDNADALLSLGGVRFTQRRYAEAEALFDRALALQPNDLEIRRVLAELSLVQDQPLTALRQLRRLQEAAAAPEVEQRIEQTQVNLLRRRGFQPSWEQY